VIGPVLAFRGLVALEGRLGPTAQPAAGAVRPRIGFAPAFRPLLVLGLTKCSQGSFNYDNTINLQDFNLLAANFGLTVASASTSARGRETIAVLPERDPGWQQRVACEIQRQPDQRT
jgi:hypothetical protein